MPANNIKITELDFDLIKANLITYLQSLPAFTDYNFAGSGLNTIIDLLAANTHYQAFFANMLFNEGFLDTAVKRSSVVSRAKELGYTPKSAVGATATVNVQVLLGTNPPPAGVELPAGTMFGSSGFGQSSQYAFYNPEKLITVADGNNQYWFNNLVIKEGSPNRTRFVVDTSNPDQKFIIPNTNIDLSTLKVTVQASLTDTTTTTFLPASNYTIVASTDPVYFVQEDDGELFEIYFGDGNVGLPVVSGNVVICEYMVVAGPDANGLSTFSLSGSLLATDSSNSFSARVDTVADSAGGADIESIDSVRFYAPKAWTAQNRLVTKDDYVHYLLNNIPNIESVTVWGGEDAIPPQYGKVFISLKPNSGFKFSDVAKANISANLVKQRSLVSVIPEFLDPDYIYVGVNCKVNYQGTQTNKTDAIIASEVATSIQAYFNTNLERFNNNFYYSKLLAAIDATDPSIVSNDTLITIQKRLTPLLFHSIGYTLSYSPNKIHPSTLTTNYFSCIINGHQYDNVYFADLPYQLNFSTSYNGLGYLQLFDSTNTLILSNVGTVNYATGVISVNPIEFISTTANDGLIRFTVQLQEATLDIQTVRNAIIVLDDTVADPLSNILTNGLVVSAQSIS